MPAFGVLIVDDDPGDRDLLQEDLESAGTGLILPLAPHRRCLLRCKV